MPDAGEPLFARTGPTVAAPSNVVASRLSASEVKVTWQDNSSNETGFEVWRAQGGPDSPFNQLVTASANTTAHLDAGLAAWTQYCYRVRTFRAYDGKTSYSAFSTAACATTPAPPPPPPSLEPPAAPTLLWAYPSPQIIGLEWLDNSNDEWGFKVERCQETVCSDADFTVIRVVGTTGYPSYYIQDGDVAPGSTYTYRVRAFSNAGDSAPSNTWIATACFWEVSEDGLYVCVGF